MVFSILHWLPSAIAAVLVIALAFARGRERNLALGSLMAVFAIIGLAGYLQAGDYNLTPLDFHTLHAMLGIATLLVSLAVFAYAMLVRRKDGEAQFHCWPGYLAAALAAVTLLMGLLLLLGLAPGETGPVNLSAQVPASGTLPEMEATEFQGIALTPLSAQGNTEIAGTQHINRSSYRLQVTGLVERPMNFTYDDLLQFPAYSEAAYMPCVEGWGFMAKWTGLRLGDLLDRAGAKPEARYIIFYAVDNYSTSLPIDYVKANNILLAYGINDVTLPPERGFPFQVVAKSKYGYKWAKWVDRIEVSAVDKPGYWESNGYSNSANVGEFPYG